MRMPFHVTCVCDGPVPRNDTVESVARPYCLTKTGVLNVSTSAIERAMFSLRSRRVEFRLLDADASSSDAGPRPEPPGWRWRLSRATPPRRRSAGFPARRTAPARPAPAAAPETAASKETRRLFSCSPVISSKNRSRRDAHVKFSRQARPWPYSGRRLPAAGSRRRRQRTRRRWHGSTVESRNLWSPCYSRNGRTGSCSPATGMRQTSRSNPVERVARVPLSCISDGESPLPEPELLLHRRTFRRRCGTATGLHIRRGRPRSRRR